MIVCNLQMQCPLLQVMATVVDYDPKWRSRLADQDMKPKWNTCLNKGAHNSGIALRNVCNEGLTR
jgi:hypothetical protein